MSIFSSSRDVVQRSFGCIGLSVVAHVAALAAMLVTSNTGLDAAKSKDSGALELQPALESAPRTKPSFTQHEVILTEPAKTQTVTLTRAKKKSSAAANTAKSQPAPALVVQKASDVAVDEPEVETNKLEDFQPNSIADVEEKNPEIPENLSPEISEDPIAENEAKEEAPLPAPVIAEIPISQPAPAPPQAQPAAAPAPVAAKGFASSGGSAVNGVTTGGSGFESLGAGAIVDASLRKPTSRPQPTYSQRDRLLKNEGLVVVTAKVLRDGSVNDVKLEKSTGSKDMDRAAVEAFKKWKFAPGPEVTVRNPFKFVLKGDSKVEYAKLRR